MKFGIIKSKIENVLVESYKNNTFKTEMKNFKTLVLENKNIIKLFYLYDELNSNKGLNESVVDDYILECVKIYENTVNKIKKSDLQEISLWLHGVNSKNIYENIDNLFNVDILNIESRIKSKKIISENLKKKPLEKKDVMNIPLSTMVNVANKTIVNHINNLNESEKKELMDLLSIDDKELKVKFDSIKESIVNKLNSIKESEKDSTTKNRINEALEKVSSEKYDKLTFFKLKNLNETL